MSMTSIMQFVTQPLRRRISRRVAFWIFVSIVTIEAIILIPSSQRHERELISQLQNQTALKLTWLMATVAGDRPSPLTAIEAQTVLDKLQSMAFNGHSLQPLGGVIYNDQGTILATFGDRPALTWQLIQQGIPSRQDKAHSLFDSSWTATALPHSTIVLRHDITPIQQALQQYQLRIGALVMIISLFVTGSTLLVMQILVIDPVLQLRDDLRTAGELVITQPDRLYTADLYALNHHRRDELGDVMDEFRSMLTRITQEIQQRTLAEQSVREEQAKSEELLLNVLPAAVAQELKENRRYIAEGFASVSVLFADLVGFTTLSARKEPVEIVTLLNDIFSSFDRLSEIYGLEKIKTIGDAYMVAGGLPMPHDNPMEAIADMALEMLQEIERMNQMSGDTLQLRIGIHCGPVVAGVIGTRKFIYDLWGDTVNIASRMESQGLPGSIQITSEFQKQLGDRYKVQQREKIHVRGRGLMQTYWLLAKQLHP